MTRRQRREIFNRQVKRALAGDLHSAELALRLDAQCTPEDEQRPVKIVFKMVPDAPDDAGDVIIEAERALPAGQEQRLLAAGPDYQAEPVDGPAAPTVVVEPAPKRQREPSCFEELTQQEQEAYAADGWRSAPSHLRPQLEGCGEDYSNDGFGGPRRGRSYWNMDHPGTSRNGY